MKIKKNDGITVIELIVVTTIVSILAVALSFSFQNWMGGYKVESQVKEMYVDLMNTRARALQRNRAHFVDFPTADSYRISEDDSDGGAAKIPDGDGVLQPQADPLVVTPNTDTTLPTFPRTLENFLISMGGTITWAGGIITLNSRGIVEIASGATEETMCIFTDFDGDGTSDVDPDYDCIVISQTRINLGRLATQDTAGGLCDSANCDTR